MFGNARLISLVPDKPGRGGCKQGQHSFLTDQIHDTYATFNVHLREGSWRVDNAAESINQAAYPTWGPVDLNPARTVRSCFVFNYYSTTDPSSASTPFFVSHAIDGSNAYLIRHGYGAGGGAVAALTLRSDTSGKTVPATYANIQNRLVMAWGGNQELPWVYDASNPTSAGYRLGAPQPANAPPYTISRPTSTITDKVCVLTGQYYLTMPDSADPDLTTFQAIKRGSKLTIQGIANFVAEQDAISSFAAIGTITEWKGTGGGGDGKTVKINTPLSPPGAYVGLLIRQPSTSREGIIKAISTTAEETVLTLDSPINVVADYTGAYELAGGLIKLTTAWTGGEYVYGGSSPQYTPCSLGYPSGPLSWVGRGPQYGYAWYDYRTGHISNLSPIIQVTEQDETGVSVSLDPDQFSMLGTDEGDATDLARFTSTVIFRTLLSGGVGLFPVGTLPDAGSNYYHLTVNSLGTWTDAYQDDELLVNERLQAPLTTNGRPMKLDTSGPSVVTACCFWDGRLWLAPLDDPTAIQYSADPIQAPFGVNWECFPARNRLRVSADDGRVLGFKLFGTRMVVLTERYAYYISGNHETNYRALRYSASMGGVGPYQVDEIPAETDGEDSSLVYFHRDQMIYAYTPGSRPKEIGDAIAGITRNYGDDWSSYQNCRVAVMSVYGRRCVVVKLLNSTASMRVLTYDLKTGIWNEHSPAVYGSPTASGQHFLQMTGNGMTKALFNQAGAWFEWIGKPQNFYMNTAVTPYIQTMPMDFQLPKVLKTLNFIRLYVSANLPSPGAGESNWKVYAYPNETYELTGTPGELSEVDRKLWGGGDGTHTPLDGADVKELVLFPNAMQMTHNIGDIQATSGYPVGPVTAYRYSFKVEWPVKQTMGTTRLYAMQICYTPVSEEGSVQP